MARRQISAPTPPPEAPPPIPAETKTNISRAELANRLGLVELLMQRGAGEARVAAFCHEHWGLRRKAARRLIERVKTRWAEEMERDRPRWKAEQIQRLKSRLAILMSGPEFDQMVEVQDPRTKKKTTKLVKGWNHLAIDRIERLLSDITGTKEPLKVNLEITEGKAIDRVLMDLTPEQFQRTALQYLETKALAEKARVLLHLPDGVEVLGKPVGELVAEPMPTR